MTKRFCSILGLLAFATSLSFGQVALTQTTLSAAIGRDDPVIGVASATGITASGSLNQTITQLVIDREAMKVISVSGTQITVIRGIEGVKAAHNSGAAVYVGPPQYFGHGDPLGSCTSANILALPLVVPVTGGVWQCVGSLWTRAVYNEVASNVLYTVAGSATVAVLNTGKVLVPATPGVTYKVVGASILPVGGTVATCTAINVTDSDLSTTQVFSFLVSGTLTAIIYDEASPAAQVTVGGGTAFGTAFAAGKGIGIISTGSTCTTTTSLLYKVTYTASF
jgi:hypothetical protein